ncbi:hypothetical protein ACVILE_006492 [Streptomyces sp. M18.1]
MIAPSAVGRWAAHAVAVITARYAAGGILATN